MSDEHNNEPDNVMGSSIEMLRDHAIKLFNDYVGSKTGLPVPPAPDDFQRQFLSLEETEAILKEHSLPGTPDGMYVLGGESPEELQTQMRKLFAALMTRIDSNTTAYGVKQGFIECAVDSESGKFVFEVTAKGKEIANAVRKQCAPQRRKNIEPSNN